MFRSPLSYRASANAQSFLVFTDLLSAIEHHPDLNFGMHYASRSGSQPCHRGQKGHERRPFAVIPPNRNPEIGFARIIRLPVMSTNAV
jgi:hypothetical protein